MFGFVILAFAIVLMGGGLFVLIQADPIEGVRARRMASVLAAAGRRQGAFETALLAQREAAMRRATELAAIKKGRQSWIIRQRDMIRRAGLGRLPWPLYVVLLLGVGRLEAMFAGPMVVGALRLPEPFTGLISFVFMIVSALGLHFVVVRSVARFRDQRRRNKALAALPEALDIAVRALRTGRNAAEAFAAAVPEISSPLKEEIERALTRVRLGQTLEVALREAGDRLGVPEIGMAATAVSIAGATGGSLAEALANLSSTLRERRQFILEVKAMTAEGKFSALIVGSLPFVIFAAILTINPGHAAPLLNDPRGQMILAAAFGLVIVGVVVLRKITRIKV